MREIGKIVVQKMLKEGGSISEPTTDWAVQVIFALKKGDTLRFCVEYRRLNAVTMRDSYPLPRIDKCIDSLVEAKVFGMLEVNIR